MSWAVWHLQISQREVKKQSMALVLRLILRAKMELESCWAQREAQASSNIFPLEPQSDMMRFRQMWRTAMADMEEKKKVNNKRKRDRTTDTFQDCQPCGGMRVPDRIARQARILPSVIKRDISQMKDFHFLVRGVNASSLENKGSRPKRPERETGGPWV